MIYLDNHATTRVDPRVVEVLAEMYSQHYANAGSVTHESGRGVAERVTAATYSLAACLGAQPEEIVITSGATESNNLALLGACLHPRVRDGQRRKVISLETEHRAVLDPLKRLEQAGFDVQLLPVHPQTGNSSAAEGQPGVVDLERLAAAIDDRTLLVSVMLANNEIGVVQPLRQIAELCQRHGVWLHSDATQAVGRMPVDVQDLQVDLLSFSAHKFYGPKGVGGLYVRQAPRRIRLQSQIVGGGQQGNRRSGTLNSPGIVAMATALELCRDAAGQEWPRVRGLRDRLYQLLGNEVPTLELNGPRLDDEQLRLGGNLNCAFLPVEGQSLMLAVPELAVSSGSACTSAEMRPSHVLRGLGLSDERARSSLRFGIGRFTTEAEIEQAARWLGAALRQLAGWV
jgi:cysteine desulfurase